MEPRSREKNGRTFPWAARKWLRYGDKLGDRMIKQLLNSIIAKYRDLSEASRSIICLSLRLRQIIDLLASDKSRYFPQLRPIIVNYLYSRFNVIWSWKSLPISLSCKLLPVQWREYQLADKISQWTPQSALSNNTAQLPDIQARYSSPMQPLYVVIKKDLKKEQIFLNRMHFWHTTKIGKRGN